MDPEDWRTVWIGLWAVVIAVIISSFFIRNPKSKKPEPTTRSKIGRFFLRAVVYTLIYYAVYFLRKYWAG